MNQIRVFSYFAANFRSIGHNKSTCPKLQRKSCDVGSCAHSGKSNNNLNQRPTNNQPNLDKSTVGDCQNSIIYPSQGSNTAGAVGLNKEMTSTSWIQSDIHSEVI